MHLGRGRAEPRYPQWVWRCGITQAAPGQRGMPQCAYRLSPLFPTCERYQKNYRLVSKSSFDFENT